MTRGGTVAIPAAMTAIERTVLAPDGWRLSALDLEPAGPCRGVVVAGHAMMVDRRTLYRGDDRPSLARTLAQHGWRVLLPDLRGHGASGPQPREGGQWRYADLVADTATWRALADEVAGGLPVAWLGHSLFGHVSLAWFGQHADRRPAAFAALAVNVWNRRFEPNPALWAIKRATMAAATTLVRLRGRMPARGLRFGSADEAAGYWLDLDHVVRTNAWQAEDGTDWHRALSRLEMPYLCVVSDGDRLFTRPDDGISFAAPLPGRQVLRLGQGVTEPSLRGLVPSHMGLATDPRSQPLWEHVASWLDRVVPQPAPG